jgi:hypothetical protein
MGCGEIARGHEDCRVEEIVVWLGTISGIVVQAFCVLWAIFLWFFCLFVALCG